MKVNGIRSVSRPVVTADGERLVSFAGAGLLCEVADLSGLTAGLTALLGGRKRRHAPGVTLVRAAAAIAAGQQNVSGVSLFCGSRPAIFEDPAAASTLRRTVFGFGEELVAPGLDRALADARAVAWRAAGYQPDGLDIDIDATLLPCHSDKEQAAGNYKGGFGYHPLVAWLDETREPLAMMLRPGNAGSNTAVDHCDVIMRSIDQLPPEYQAGHQPGDDSALVLHPVRVRADSAGATKPFLADLRGRNIGFSVGFPIDAAVRDVIAALPPQAWQPAVNADGTPRGGAEVVELAGYTALSGWPGGSRLICRREEPHPGAQLSVFDDLHGLRHTAFLTDDNRSDIARLEAEHRCHARVEDRIRGWKACGALHQPYWDAPANEAWLNVTLIALLLIAWTQHLGFAGTDLATTEPATFRTRVLAIAAQTATHGRRLHLHLDKRWPWSNHTARAHTAIRTAFSP